MNIFFPSIFIVLQKMCSSRVKSSRDPQFKIYSLTGQVWLGNNIFVKNLVCHCCVPYVDLVYELMPSHNQLMYSCDVQSNEISINKSTLLIFLWNLCEVYKCTKANKDLINTRHFRFYAHRAPNTIYRQAG